MSEVTVKVPEAIKDIISETSETIYVEALKEVARKRISYTQKRIEELEQKISVYEERYGKSYKEFSQNVPDTLEGHNDWVEWSYMVNVKDGLSNKIDKLKLLFGE